MRIVYIVDWLTVPDLCHAALAIRRHLDRLQRLAWMDNHYGGEANVVPYVEVVRTAVNRELARLQPDGKFVTIEHLAVSHVRVHCLDVKVVTRKATTVALLALFDASAKAKAQERKAIAEGADDPIYAAPLRGGKKPKAKREK